MEFLNPRIIARADKLNPKTFPIGSVVYFLKNKRSSSEKYIEFGTVLEHYASEIAVQLYERRDVRKINGISVKEFETPTPWQKLPKGWSWNTKLFEVDWEVPQEMKDYHFHLNDPQNILEAIEKGYLVKVSENDHAVFHSEVDSKHGWRIVREYDGWFSEYYSVPYYHCYSTYEEAKEELDAILAENQRQAALTDLEWSIEQIDETLNRWAYACAVTPETKNAVRDRLMALDNLEDVCVRMADNHIEWRYDRNVRWLRIEM